MPHYIAVCEREYPLSITECRDLGLETTVKIFRARESMRATRSADGIRSPVTASPVELEGIVKDLFELPENLTSPVEDMNAFRTNTPGMNSTGGLVIQLLIVKITVLTLFILQARFRTAAQVLSPLPAAVISLNSLQTEKTRKITSGRASPLSTQTPTMNQHHPALQDLLQKDLEDEAENRVLTSDEYDVVSEGTFGEEDLEEYTAVESNGGSSDSSLAGNQYETIYDKQTIDEPGRNVEFDDPWDEIDETELDHGTDRNNPGEVAAEPVPEAGSEDTHDVGSPTIRETEATLADARAGDPNSEERQATGSDNASSAQVLERIGDTAVQDTAKEVVVDGVNEKMGEKAAREAQETDTGSAVQDPQSSNDEKTQAVVSGPQPLDGNASNDSSEEEAQTTQNTKAEDHDTAQLPTEPIPNHDNAQDASGKHDTAPFANSDAGSAGGSGEPSNDPCQPGSLNDGADADGTTLPARQETESVGIPNVEGGTTVMVQDAVVDSTQNNDAEGSSEGETGQTTSGADVISSPAEVGGEKLEDVPPTLVNGETPADSMQSEKTTETDVAGSSSDRHDTLPSTEGLTDAGNALAGTTIDTVAETDSKQKENENAAVANVGAVGTATDTSAEENKAGDGTEPNTDSSARGTQEPRKETVVPKSGALDKEQSNVSPLQDPTVAEADKEPSTITEIHEEGPAHSEENVEQRDVIGEVDKSDTVQEEGDKGTTKLRPELRLIIPGEPEVPAEEGKKDGTSATKDERDQKEAMTKQDASVAGESDSHPDKQEPSKANLDSLDMSIFDDEE
ncbi:hypothetical protein VKT23_000497 [Stygiomarasmius scandens]|uniref:Uncharacterized protein n=1 Tax=Marasmiellus scandens TaxID=2682957 RepID=A0ABR1KA74_9AGAR